MEAINLYMNFIIKPLEKEVKKQRLKVKRTRYSLTKNIEKEYLYKLEKLLNNYYEDFTIFTNKILNNTKH